ncbi:alpha/beta fold hydrolase [Moritella viscosa]|uniref:Beta-ketoadipate enol-lactone hydrolase n=1 Tax=Moritella viscosa TaxID=80854 RepID=A0A1L0ARF8_9GAMM|nr:alpha/beta fold hydrolase [Moritella viscosa]SGY86773.1 Putative beta-ketoadipate enol-lactone hydrolase [Moritella viscosa]SGY90212.1 Putative beta-ketoadipate enol-lactone hydrolase [Moritella viscosa]SGY90766.1 Putative beta-ketoadipate enol-lactone hydrolase [Moritella viscosa]SHO01061.1 Putative beta-ketoadipate enol-lactone hydrolase [Moritella viscosa]SHO01362.1 Putative beta-ketoadipate enol-lactone hydrolase [Moritella viscosa]
MNTFTIDDKTMHYIDKGQGPVLILGHSYLWDSEMWTPQLDALSQHYRCIVPDLWGHGKSDDAPEKTIRLQDYARDILALMDHLAINDFSIIGLSIGGMWGAELTIIAPKRVKSLVLMDSFVGVESEVMRTKYLGMLSAIDDAQQVPAPLVDIITPMFFAQNAAEVNPELVARLRDYLVSLEGERAKQITKMGRMFITRRDAFEDIEKFALPTLIIVGEQDTARPPLESYLMQDVISGSELLVVKDAGHISNLEQPAVVTAKLLSFMENVHTA